MAGKRLLVMDDEVDFGEFVARVARNLNYEVEVVSESRFFKDTYQSFQPDVIVMDVVMPEVEGVELVQWLAGEDCRAHLIIVTGYDPQYATMVKVLGESKGLRSARTLTKPIRVADLRNALSFDWGDD